LLLAQVVAVQQASQSSNADPVPLLNVSIEGKECQMTAQEVMEMPSWQFFTLWAVPPSLVLLTPSLP